MSVAATALAVSAVSAVVGTVGALSSASAASQNASYQAQVARNNAITASQNAEYATEAGQAKATDTSLAARAQLGAVKAAEGASGLDVDTGSPAAVQQTQREVGTLNTERTVDAAALQAYGYRTQATNYVAEGQLQEQESSQALSAGDLSALGTRLGGASSVGLNYAKLNNAGVFGSSQPSVPNSADNPGVYI